MTCFSLRAAQAARFLARPVVVASSALLSGCAGQPPDPPLPQLAIDGGRVAVAGFSAGAYMATQAHLAFAERIHAAALVAGGPYGCAQGQLDRALGTCMKAAPEPPDVAVLADVVRQRAAAGAIAPLAALDGDRVLVLHGSEDAVVAPAVAASAAELYRALGAQGVAIDVRLDAERPFAHTWPTLQTGSACEHSTAPYLGRCGFEAAAEIFDALFGPADAAPAAAAGELRRFDQRTLLADADPLLADTGYLYLPAACAQGTRCGLLVVFHGCDQSVEKVGTAFVVDGGFNRWADVHRVAVLYPQARSSFMPLNPKGCWDWWGYSGAGYDTRDGLQLRWLDAALTALGVAPG